MAIKRVSERNNQRFGITGLLMFNGLNFIQYLEGDRAAANDRLHYIESDERHSGMTIISHQESPGRQFAGWDMACQFLSPHLGLAQADLSKILSDNAVAGATRAVFESFQSLGFKLPR